MSARNLTSLLCYELKMWRALFVCFRAGHHWMVGRGQTENNGPYYCWQCFYQYPNQRKLRNLIGRMIPEQYV